MADKELELARARAKAKLRLQQNQVQQPAQPQRETRFIPDEQEAQEFAPTTGEAVAGGFLQGLTSNFADDLVGEDAAQAFQSAEEQAPVASLVGNVAGGITQGLALAPKRAIDAVTGALDAAGEAEGGFADRVNAGTKGAVMGLAFGAAGKKAGKLFKQLKEGKAKKLAEAAGEAGAEAVGFDRKGAINKAFKALKSGRDQAAKKTGKLLVDMGVLRGGTSAEAIRDTLQELNEEVVAKLDNVYAQVAESGVSPVNSLDVIDEVRRLAVNRGLEKQLTSNKSARKALENFTQDITTLSQRNAAGMLDINSLRQLKQNLGQVAFDRGAADNVKNVYRDLYQLVDGQLKDAAEKLAPELREQLTSLNEQATAIIRTLPAIEDKVLRAASQSSGNLAKVAGGLAGMVAGSRVGQGVEAVVSRGTPASNAGKVAQKAAKKLTTAENLLRNPKKLGRYARILQEAANRGPRAVAVQHHMLMQTDSEYRKKVKKVSGDVE